MPNDHADLIRRAMELSNKATPGPWTVDSDSGYICIEPDVIRGASGYDGWYQEPDKDDAAFITASRELVPHLASALKAADQRIAMLEEALDIKEELNKALRRGQAMKPHRITTPPTDEAKP